MKIVVHVSGHFDWEPVPDDVVVTEHDIKALRVKPDQRCKPNGEPQWLMRVQHDKRDSHVLIAIPEQEIIESIMEGAIKEGVAWTRAEAAMHLLSRRTLKHHCARDHVEEFEIANDDDPNADGEKNFRAQLVRHVVAGNIHQSDVEGLVKAYMTPVPHADRVEHLHHHFKVDKDKRTRHHKRQAGKGGA